MTPAQITALFNTACEATAVAKAHGHEWDAGRYWQAADVAWERFLVAADEYRKRYNPDSVTAGHPDYDYEEDYFILTGAMSK
jgi:hypothetical protein